MDIFPLPDVGVTLVGHHIRELLDALGGHQRHEHSLSPPMGLIIHHLRTAFILQQPQRRLRQGALSGKPTGLIENLGRLLAHHADGLRKHEPGFEDVGSIVLAPPRDERVAVGQQCQRSVRTQHAGRQGGPNGTGQGGQRKRCLLDRRVSSRRCAAKL